QRQCRRPQRLRLKFPVSPAGSGFGVAWRAPKPRRRVLRRRPHWYGPVEPRQHLQAAVSLADLTVFVAWSGGYWLMQAAATTSSSFAAPGLELGRFAAIPTRLGRRATGLRHCFGWWPALQNRRAAAMRLPSQVIV